MAEYSILIPCTVSLSTIIEADSKEEAMEKAFDSDFKLKIENSEGSGMELFEFEMHEAITKGNVFYGVQNEVEIEKL